MIISNDVMLMNEIFISLIVYLYKQVPKFTEILILVVYLPYHNQAFPLDTPTIEWRRTISCIIYPSLRT